MNEDIAECLMRYVFETTFSAPAANLSAQLSQYTVSEIHDPLVLGVKDPDTYINGLSARIIERFASHKPLYDKVNLNTIMYMFRCFRIMIMDDLNCLHISITFCRHIEHNIVFQQAIQSYLDYVCQMPLASSQAEPFSILRFNKKQVYAIQ